MYPSDKGYRRARNILKELLDQRHLIVREMLDDIARPRGGQPRFGVVDDLRK